jgi:class 3 adenylate cyclase/pimeloyl-ACP methyl ester carboxylesterase
MEQQIRFCTSADGTRIAYATYSARTNDPLLVSRGFGYAQEGCWQEPQHRRLLEELGRDRMLVTYDRRGFGGSQRDVTDLSDEAEASDLAAVADAAGLGQFDIDSFHMIGAAYASTHRERVLRLVLWEPYVRPRDTGFLKTIERTTKLIRTEWAMARRLLGSYVFPDGPAELQRWYSTMLRDGTSPEVAASLLEAEAAQDIDYTDMLSRIQAPTLVLHSRTGRMVPLSASQQVAACIPNARFQPLDRGALAPETDELIISFLDEERGARLDTSESAVNVVAILFTDIAASTALTQRLGDVRAQELVRSHNEIVRKALRQHGGSEIKHTGDGIMASFPSASGALDCAIGIQRAVAEQGDEHLAVHIGVNAGEPVAEESDLFGTSVQLARRICDHAESGQILVSNVVRELSAGKGFLFDERDVTALRGFEEPVRLYEVRWRE